ncbi:MAG: hypothetical protein ABIA75_11270 [Candidatus Neomarinimicrobiota bacterium]
MKEKVGYDPKIHNRHSLRLPECDYTGPGYYFVTINVQNQIHLFGEVEQQQMKCNQVGEIVRRTWLWLARQYS